MRCTILYDNVGGKGLNSGHGFSCLVEAHGKRILFDTGDDGQVLLSNMKKLGIKPHGIGCVFISHGHLDHCGGLAAFVDTRGNLPVYVPESAFHPVKQVIGDKAEIIPVSEPGELFPGYHTTGELAGIEQSLVVETRKGNIVITGCGHPGLFNIIQQASVFGKVYGAIGGFHGFSDLQRLKGLELIVPCHCTMYKQEMLARFPDAAVECTTGAVFEVK